MICKLETQFDFLLLCAVIVAAHHDQEDDEHEEEAPGDSIHYGRGQGDGHRVIRHDGPDP